MERQNRKRQGLYIRKDAALLKTVSLKDFSFEDICEHSLLFHDNPNANLIYRKFHEPDEIASAIKPHHSLHNDVREPDAITPILQPIDFTDDWKRQQDRVSKRLKGRVDDDEEFELELEIARRKEEERLNEQEDGDFSESSSTGPEEVDEDSNSSMHPGVNNSLTNPLNGNEEQIIAEIRADDASPIDRSFKVQKDSLDAVGEVIKTYNEHEKLETVVHDTPPSDSAFIPVNTAQGTDPEKSAMEEYEAQQLHKEEKYKKVYEQAKAEGFEAGFKEGEAKGVAQLHDLSSKVVENVSQLIDELSSLKRNILQSAEDNFMQVCQALGESLIGQEFTLNPESFKAVIQKAIGEAMPDDKFKVRVHPAFLAHLQKTNLGTLESKLVGDESIEPGSFKVESELSSIEGDLKQMITDLLEAAQADLFSKKQEVAG